MLDIKYLRENVIDVENAYKTRGLEISLVNIISFDDRRKKLLQEIESLRNRRNIISSDIGKLRNEVQHKTKIERLKREIENIKNKIKEKEKILNEIETELQNSLLQLPNIPDKTVPVGKSEKDNAIIRIEGKQKNFDFTPLPHWEIGKKLDILDFEIASKISGARFALLKKQGAQLERALITFMLDLHIKKHNYTEIFAPYLVNEKSVIGTGQLPKFKEEIFKCKDDQLYLIPTAEVSVTNIHRDEIIPEKSLPKNYVSYSACFRREAGSYGKDTKGLIRNHQFNKVELVKIVKPEESINELELLVSNAEEVLRQLGLYYRIVELCTHELGFAGAKTYDLEVWMPGEKRWREISSCTNFKDFQARRLNIKFQRENGTKEYVHTLNGSGVAIGRTFAAILENYQNSDGSVSIPEVLYPYLNFKEIKI